QTLPIRFIGTSSGSSSWRPILEDRMQRSRPAATLSLWPPRKEFMQSELPDLEPGRTLPNLAIKVDRGFIVASAIASRDYEPVHHDPDAARTSGSPDIFLNIL